MINKVDIVCGLTWGDEGKGKIIGELLKTNKYDWVCRWNGGSNAGHTIYLNNTKYHTHIIPSGILYGVKCLIGPECFVNIDDLNSEMEYLKGHGFDISLLKISPYVKIITPSHKEEDANNPNSTGKGIGPCARDKYARKAIQLKDHCPESLKSFLMTEDLHGNILCEGAQGFWLDINYGNYPYVTSSVTLPYSACSLGFPPCKINTIYGAAKIYDTRVGYDPDFENMCQPEEETIDKIVDVGKEYGTTTGRPRKVSWLNYDKLVKAINISGTNVVIISKVDILEIVNKFIILKNNKYIQYETLEIMKKKLGDMLFDDCKLIKKIIYSDHPEHVEF